MNQSNTLLQITKESMGEGDPELGKTLIFNYFNILLINNMSPKIIVFYNAGVNLLSKTSPIIDLLRQLEQKGVQLLACKTCVNFYKTPIEVGTIGTMEDIITLQAKAQKVISI